MAHDRARPLGEDERRRRRLDALLLGVFAVVPPDRDDLAGARHGREELGLGDRPSRRRRCGRPPPPSRSAASPAGPAANRSAIVRGPPARTVAAGSQRSSSTIPRTSPVADRLDSRRTMAPGGSVVQYSVRWTEDWTIRYAPRPRQPRLDEMVQQRMPFDPTERVPLGRTGLAVSRLGFGGASIGGLFTAVDEDAAIDVVRHAWDLGIRSFDTAPLYGYGASERRIGAALRGPPARRLRAVDEGRAARPRRRRHPARCRHRPPGPRRPRRRLLRPGATGPAGVRLQRGRRPPLDRRESRAARPRPHRHRADPRPG